MLPFWPIVLTLYFRREPDELLSQHNEVRGHQLIRKIPARIHNPKYNYL